MVWPTMFIAELEHPEFNNYDLGSLRTGIMAGSPCPVEVMKQVIELMNMHEVEIAYGIDRDKSSQFPDADRCPL